MSTKERSVIIDIMKGLLITLVVIGHLPFFEYDSRTLTLIYSFHMPAFVIIGGMLSHIDEKSKLSKILLKRIKSSLVPYFIYYIITFIIIPTTYIQRINALQVVIKGIGIPPDAALNLPLWFLTYYFVVMTLFEIIQFLSFKIHKLVASKNIKSDFSDHLIDIITFIFIAIIMFISYKYARVYKLKRLPYNVEIAGFSLGFVFIGNLTQKYLIGLIKKINFKNIINIIISIFVILIILVLWYKLSMKNGRIDLNARDYKNAFLMYVNATLGFILLSFFSYVLNILPNIKFLTLNTITQNILRYASTIFNYINNLFSFLGKNSIHILAFHIPSTYYRNAYIIPFLPQNIQQMLFHNSIISILLLTTYGIAFSIILSIIIKNIYKYIYSHIKKN